MSSWNVTKEVAQAWIDGKNHFLANLTAALNGGILIANGGENRFTNAYNLETWMPHQISSVQHAAASGKVVRVKTNAYLTGREQNDVRDAMAAFLIGTGPGVFFSGPYSVSVGPTHRAGRGADPPGYQHEWGLWDIQQRWRPEFEYPLGEPNGKGVQGDDGVWRRSFPGAEVSFNLTCGQGTIRWTNGNVTRGTGHKCSSAPLPAPSSRQLKTDDGRTPNRWEMM